jgi:2-methylcitrate dehydratase
MWSARTRKPAPAAAIRATISRSRSPDSVWDGISISGLVAPAVAGWLLRLPEETLAHAIALSAARAATPVAVREGGISAAKNIANALIAQNGMQATLLAQQGVTGPLDLFEAERGLRAVFSRGPAGEIFAAPWPDESFIMRSAIKAYPCFAGGQSAVAAGIALHRRVGGNVDQLKTIRVALADLPMVHRWLADPGRIGPRSREAADHSLHFLIAVALDDGTFGLRQFDNARWNDAKMRALMARLDITTDADLTRRAGEAYPCAIHATGHDGQPYDVEILEPPGFSPDGLDTQTVLDKFARVTERHLPPDAQSRIVNAVMALDKAISCDGVMRLLATERTAL